jgi:hypothetical protein
VWGLYSEISTRQAHITYEPEPSGVGEAIFRPGLGCVGVAVVVIIPAPQLEAVSCVPLQVLDSKIIFDYGNSKMIRNMLKIISTLCIGYILGLTFGIIFGIFLGGIPSLFFREIVNSHQTVLMSISLALILGVLLGFFAMHLVNKIFAASDKPLIGALLGIAVSLMVVFFVEGVIDISDPEMFVKPMGIYPIIYGGILGSDIGSIVFPIIGTTRVIRDILANNKETRKDDKSLEQIQKFFGIHLPNKEKRG